MIQALIFIALFAAFELERWGYLQRTSKTVLRELAELDVTDASLERAGAAFKSIEADTRTPKRILALYGGMMAATVVAWTLFP